MRKVALTIIILFLFIPSALAIEWNTVTFNIPATSGNRVTINGSGTIHSVVYTLDSGSNGAFSKSSDFPLPQTFVTTEVRTFTQFVVQSNPADPMPSNVSITVENVDTGSTQTFTNGVYSNGSTPPASTTMTLTATDNGDGSSDFTWSPVSGAYSYKLYINGSLSGTYSSSTTTVTEMVSTGTAQIMAYDMNGNLIGQSDTISFGSTTDPPPDGGTGGDTGGTTCGECEKLAEMLACPDWDTYMGELTNAFSNAFPPPPNWEEVADTMADALVPPIVAAVEDSADQISNQVDQTGKEIINSLGNANYDGNSGLNTPTMTPYQNSDVPNLADKDISQTINENINENVPVFEVVDETEEIEIPDPYAWESPASQAKPTPNQDIGAARPTIPVTTIEKTTTGSKPVIPSGDPALSPRETTPTDTGGLEPVLTNPGAKDAIPTDWRNTTP